MVKNIFIITNTKCNLRCKYCYYDNEKRRDNHYLNPNMLKIFIDKKVERISITGGEPLLNPFLKEYLNIAKGKARKIILSTNGLLITDDIIKMLKENNVDKVFISLDSVNNKVHNVQRCNSMSLVLSAIKKLIENKIGLQIATVVTAKNIDHIYKIEQFCIERKIKFWPQPIVTKNKSLDLKYIPRQKWNKFLNSQRNTPVVKNFIINYYKLFIKTTNNIPRICPLKSTIVIDTNGNIRRCFFSKIISNINNSKLSKIILNNQYANCFGSQCFQYLLSQ